VIIAAKLLRALPLSRQWRDKGKISHLGVLCASSEAGGECPAYSVIPARLTAGESVGSSDPEKHRRGAGEKKLVGYAKALCSYHGPAKEKT